MCVVNVASNDNLMLIIPICLLAFFYDNLIAIRCIYRILLFSMFVALFLT